MDLDLKKQKATDWFRDLRNQICAAFEDIEAEYAAKSGDFASPEHASCGVQEKTTEAKNTTTSGDFASPERVAQPAQFNRAPWTREEGTGGGGEMSVMRGRVFEKVGVNISTVHGEFSETFRKEIPGAAEDPRFWAAGISLVAHMRSPLVPAVHMNTRMIVVGEAKLHFGGGADLTPMVPDETDTADFHAAFQTCCDAFDPEYYAKFKKWCDEYFFLKHRNEPRGVGGIFYDYVNTGKWEQDFDFTRSVGETFRDIYPQIVRRHMYKPWTAEQREHQLIRRGRYVEFNLLWDRGTRFGIMTGGNTEAILMSLPPEAKWP